MQDFRRLEVWRRAHALAVVIRRSTHAFPRTGYAELKSQLTRASESIASNIAEGCAAATPQEFARYLDISIKSTSETEYRLQLAKDLRVLAAPSSARLSGETVEIRKMLFGLRGRVLAAAQAADEEEGDAKSGPARGKRRRRHSQLKTDPLATHDS